MNYKTLFLTIAAIAAGVYLISPAMAFAYRGDASVKGPNHTEARERAIESADLSAFRAACTVGRMCDVVNTQEKLTVLKQMHEAMESGDVTKAQELRASLGLGLKNGSGQGKGMGMGRNRN